MGSRPFKTLYFLLAIYGLTVDSSFGLSPSPDIYKNFIEFKQKYGKQYEEGSIEFIQRYKNFKITMGKQPSENTKNETVKRQDTANYGVTKFSDMDPAEFKELYLQDLIIGSISPDIHGKQTPWRRIASLKIPSKLDWRSHLNHTVVSAVKNQRKCGACWAFSTVETVESMYAISNNLPVPSLSVQEVIDCSDYNLGCSGGDTCLALKWLYNSKVPLVTDAAYPLTDTSNFCKLLPNRTSGVTVYNYTCAGLVEKEDVILKLLYEVGPVTVSVDATTWSNYQGGIIQWHCSNQNNHAVQIVGYDLTGDVPYYIVRNSWGTDFGNQGYLYIKIGANVCGIAQEVATVHTSQG